MYDVQERFVLLALELFAADFGEQVMDDMALHNIATMLEVAHNRWDLEQAEINTPDFFKDFAAMFSSGVSPMSASASIFPPRTSKCSRCGGPHDVLFCPESYISPTTKIEEVSPKKKRSIFDVWSKKDYDDLVKDVVGSFGIKPSDLIDKKPKLSDIGKKRRKCSRCGGDHWDGYCVATKGRW